MGLIQGTHHVSLRPATIAAFERTVAFYRDTLGLSVVRGWGEGEKQAIMLDTGNSILEISVNAGGKTETGSIHHFALTTADVDACVKAVRDAGYSITIEPKDIPIQAESVYPIRMAFCIGPVGEEIEFFTEL